MSTGNNMDRHLDDRELLMHADGELGEERSQEVREHLAACWSCRGRLQEMESTIGAFTKAHHDRLNASLPASEAPRALLKVRLAQASSTQSSSLMHRIADFLTQGNRPAYAGAAFMAITVLILAIGLYKDQQLLAQIAPNPALTPGVALPISESEVCSGGVSPQVASSVPAAMGREVFARYGIQDPGNRSYELDFLIAPELGGAPEPGNFWPQPYSAPGWNSHVKDALEDRLHQLVCEEKISLATAQHEIATDWISAYKKYFDTDKPIKAHGRFEKDRPWTP